MERRPYLNPHKDAELQRGKAADRFEAGPSTVKAARIEPVVTRALGAGAWQSFKDWTSLQGNPSPYGTYGKERYRPPPISIGSGPNYVGWENPNPGPNYVGSRVTGVPFMYSNHPVEEPELHDVVSAHWMLDGRYVYDTQNMAAAFEEGGFMSVQDAHQQWNSYTS